MIIQAKPGTVYLVGAGPGDPSLITVRGYALMQQADVVVYDRLVHPDLLEAAPHAAERIYVGKAPGRHVCTQEEINALLAARASQGCVVIRLKGGDPFVFGRGGEEGQALAGAGVPFEVVPGITSAVSVPAYAGIPVTHRGVAGAFTVVTGHACDAASSGLDWEALSRAGTLVILMGLGELPHIVRQLLEQGRSPETPVAVIRCGSTAEQEVVEGTLASIVEQAAALRPPATVVVGEVVRLRRTLDWFDAAHAPASGFPFVRGFLPRLPEPAPPAVAARAVPA